MGKFDALKYAGEALKITGENGAFLVTGKGGKNVMTIGWGAQSVMWYKSLFIVPVRKSRYTHTFLENHKEFTVFVPSEGMKKEIGVCGSKSGRDTDKFALCGFSLEPSRTVDVPHIAGKGFIYECRVVYETDLNEGALDPAVVQSYYSGADTGNMHTLYFGEILAAYET
jgi:flavin reductase (DIM6/NTAB) family NADH-FMN oxidoreductase RutF